MSSRYTPKSAFFIVKYSVIVIAAACIIPITPSGFIRILCSLRARKLGCPGSRFNRCALHRLSLLLVLLQVSFDGYQGFVGFSVSFTMCKDLFERTSRMSWMESWDTGPRGQCSLAILVQSNTISISGRTQSCCTQDMQDTD